MLESLLSLNALPKIGPVRIRRLLEAFGDAKGVLAASENDLCRVDGIGPGIAKLIREADSLTDPVAELAELKQRGLSVITSEDPSFPASLLESYDCPLLLYVWGEILPRDRNAIGIVGTRRCTHYGRNITKKFSFQLARAGYTILSGLALGVDTCAHEAALAAGGRTIAVIGSGLSAIYPSENLPLAQKIANGHGAVVSEYPLHSPPSKTTFPQRNRIVAAWTKALLVTESPGWSGSLITANLANEYGHPVYAVPGPVDRPSSAGCHKLIRNGATLVTDASEILDDFQELPLSFHTQKSPTSVKSDSQAEKSTDIPLPQLSEEEQKILDAMGSDETGIDRLVDVTGLSAAIISTALLKLEMKSQVSLLPGFRYIRKFR